jgi:hypothetical protein
MLSVRVLGVDLFSICNTALGLLFIILHFFSSLSLSLSLSLSRVFLGVKERWKGEGIGKEEGEKEDIPSSFLIQPPRSISDLLIGVSAHGVAGFLLDEIKS